MRSFSIAALGFSVALGLSLVGAAEAEAQIPDAPADPSEEAFEEGRRLFVEGMARAERAQWRDAHESFERSYELSGSPVALFNLASTLRSLGRYRDAADACDRLLEDSELDLTMRSRTIELRDEVAGRVARLTLEGVPAGEPEIYEDGRARPTSRERPIRLDLDAGHHALELNLTGYTGWRWEGALEEGETRTITVDITALEGVDGEGGGGDWLLPTLLAAGGAIVLAILIGVLADDAAQLGPRTDLSVRLP